MFEHTQNLALTENKKIVFPSEKSTKSRFFGKLRYWWAWFVVGVIVLFVATPLLFVYRFRKNRDGLFSWCDWGARSWLQACGVDVNVSGLENLKEDESYVFISNHRSYLDTATLYVYAGKRVGLVAKRELLKVPIFGYGMQLANVIAIDRSNPEKARLSMAKARKIMSEGYSFGVFAEGTRALPRELLPFKKGAIHLALQTGAPIVPVVFKNTDLLMGKRTGVVFPGTIEMVVLPPIPTEGKDASNDLMPLLLETRAAVARELASGSNVTLPPNKP